ncbi:tRNA (adenosine(37)-N6)-threonylcarbamoyltransferase complex transferase subunit TsaD [Halobacteriovorax sp. HLS]|uniref:tRNA (adenosine(37)-N6)-threonylcarbamoyltransferase complex transferase subunit TsaD n=1 Tax=Halobacteriovorax sp. HLS TaxID=2234000 RepID=UPI000FD886ED|nr:tRNA (adenosine(37)-N6)-threonylcarbamoyltransferase complex transferase subunit TsaD [Halobacteriovorax sp. HLS]
MTTKFILGIETSCDDTSIAVLECDFHDLNTPPSVLTQKSFSQEQLLSKWGGVVPEIAARNHLAKLVPLLESTLDSIHLDMKDIDAIGVTTSPGLLGPLLTGLNTAKTLSLIFEKPIIPVNHLFAHLEAIHLTRTTRYPYIGLLVSGGHSLFLLVKSQRDFEILGSTIDDAAGEAFDKGGKILGLGYPAGRIIDDLAKEGDPLKYQFPIGLKSSADCRLSYSGVKTALRLFVEQNPHVVHPGGDIYSQDIKDVCASYQHAIVGALKLKLKYAMKKVNEDHPQKLEVVVGGGVACNSYLRKVLIETYRDVFFVTPKYCTDNGAMVANYASRIYNDAIDFPECLTLDAKGRYISKKDLQEKRNL